MSSIETKTSQEPVDREEGSVVSSSKDNTFELLAPFFSFCIHVGCGENLI